MVTPSPKGQGWDEGILGQGIGMGIIDFKGVGLNKMPPNNPNQQDFGVPFLNPVYLLGFRINGKVARIKHRGIREY